MTVGKGGAPELRILRARRLPLPEVERRRGNIANGGQMQRQFSICRKRCETKTARKGTRGFFALFSKPRLVHTFDYFSAGARARSRRRREVSKNPAPLVNAGLRGFWAYHSMKKKTLFLLLAFVTPARACGGVLYVRPHARKRVPERASERRRAVVRRFASVRGNKRASAFILKRKTAGRFAIAVSKEQTTTTAWRESGRAWAF